MLHELFGAWKDDVSGEEMVRYQDAEFVLEVLRRIASVTVTPVGRKPKPKDETDYLLSNPANAKASLNAIERLERGESQQHDLLEA